MPNGNMGVSPVIPDPNVILSGGTVVTNSVTSTAFLTIPAGRTWQGHVSVCAQSGATTSSVQNARVVTAGTGAVPAAATILTIALSGRDTSPGVMPQFCTVVAPAGNAVTLNLVNSTATTFSGAASANGVLLT